LLSHPAHSKYSRRWSQGRGLRSGRGFLGSLWRDRKEDQDQEETKDKQMFSTIKSTRATSSNGDNYIILSPVNPEGQVVCTRLIPAEVKISSIILGLGCPSKASPATPPPCLFHNPEPWLWIHLETLETTRTVPLFSPIFHGPDMETTPPFHPKLLSFPSLSRSEPFTSSFRTTLELYHVYKVRVGSIQLESGSEQQKKYNQIVFVPSIKLTNKSSVTVLIYSDLMLITRKDEAGHCNVLQSPLYLNMLQLREGTKLLNIVLYCMVSANPHRT
ncbi:hypothetical protein XENOCAPTIV_009872, partial [Xenoophorus captivus]